MVNSIRNSAQLIEKVSKVSIQPSSCMLVSLDVSNLFTNIPVNEVLGIMQNKLDKCHISDIHSKELYKLLEACLKQNFFTFNKEI